MPIGYTTAVPYSGTEEEVSEPSGERPLAVRLSWLFLRYCAAFGFCASWLLTAVFLTVGTLIPPFEPGYDPARDWEAQHFWLCLIVGACMIVAMFGAIMPCIEYVEHREKQRRIRQMRQ